MIISLCSMGRLGMESLTVSEDLMDLEQDVLMVQWGLKVLEDLKAQARCVLILLSRQIDLMGPQGLIILTFRQARLQDLKAQ